MRDKRRGLRVGFRKSGPATRINFCITFWGVVITLILGVLSYIYFRNSATFRGQIKSLDNELKILQGLTTAQEDRNKKFYSTLKNIEKSIFLNSNLEWIKAKVFLKDTDNIDRLKGVIIFCEFIKANVLNPKLLIFLPDQSNIGFFNGRQRINKMLMYDNWAKADENSNFNRVHTSANPQDKYIEGWLYIHPSENEKMRSLRLSDFNDALVRLLVNGKALKVIEKIEILLNNGIVLAADTRLCKIEEIKFNEFPTAEFKTEFQKSFPNEKWYLLGECRKDTIGVEPFKLQFLEKEIDFTRTDE